MNKVSAFVLSGLIILCGCREKASILFYKEQPAGPSYDYIEQLFPLPFYEKNTVRYIQQSSQIAVSGFIVDSLEHLKDFSLVQADQAGWCLDIEISFQEQFILSFKKANQAAVVVGTHYELNRVKAEIYIKSAESSSW